LLKELKRKIIFSALLIIFIIAFGTLGYMIVEGWNFLDSLYMTILTLTTVGYREVHDLSSNGTRVMQSYSVRPIYFPAMTSNTSALMETGCT